MNLSHLVGDDDQTSDDGCRVEQAVDERCSCLSSVRLRWDGAVVACSMQLHEMSMLLTDVAAKDIAWMEWSLSS